MLCFKDGCKRDTRACDIQLAAWDTAGFPWTRRLEIQSKDGHPEEKKVQKKQWTAAATQLSFSSTATAAELGGQVSGCTATDLEGAARHKDKTAKDSFLPL